MKFLKLSHSFVYKLKILSLLFISTSTILIYSCFDCCTNESAYIKTSYLKHIDKKEEQISSNSQTYEKTEKQESLSQTDNPIQLQAEEKIINTPPTEINKKEQLEESAPHFIDEINNTKDNFYSPTALEKQELLNTKNIPSSQTTNTNSIQLGNIRTFNSDQAFFNRSLHNLNPAEQAVIFSQRKLLISQNSIYSSSNNKSLTKSNEIYTNHHHYNDDDDDDKSAQISQPSTIDSMVAKAAWATAVFQSDNNSASDKTNSEGAKSFSGPIHAVSQNENSGVEKS